MIPRYSRPEMSQIWEDEHRFSLFLKIELAALEAMEKEGLVPRGITKNVSRQASFDVQRILDIEKETRHDILAFLQNVEENIADKDGRFLHMGMTSSDVLDTCLSLQLQHASNILLADLQALLVILKKKAIEHQYTLCMGRSHGMHAEPTTFGLKMCQAYAEFYRHKHRLESAREEISICMISGAVGTYAHLPPSVEEWTAKILGLRVEDISTQVIPRDRHAFFFSVLGGIASSIERLSIEIRHLQRTEVNEVRESFSKKQKGSSAMPHKRNPILSENLTGLARLVRSYVVPSLENVALWHERDISHSSAERVIAPDATIALDFALSRLTHVVEEMEVDKQSMQKNMLLTNGVTLSQKILLMLINRGMERSDAYVIVQRCAMAAVQSNRDFYVCLKEDKDGCKLSLPDQEVFLKEYTQNIDAIFKRVFGVISIRGHATGTVS